MNTINVEQILNKKNVPEADIWAEHTKQFLSFGELYLLILAKRGAVLSRWWKTITFVFCFLFNYKNQEQHSKPCFEIPYNNNMAGH